MRGAVAWLGAFGFVERLRIGENHRSQLSVGDGGAVILGDMRHDRVPSRAGESTHSVMVRSTSGRSPRRWTTSTPATWGGELQIS